MAAAVAVNLVARVGPESTAHLLDVPAAGLREVALAGRAVSQ
jgi:hypothetical protein